MTPEPIKRQQIIGELRQQTSWDVIVVGGGATGLGAAVDAASRGYRTLLLEAHDFAKGTSSRATKLLHGGVRYLAQGDIALVRHALRERGLLRQNAPHLARTTGFLIPTYSWFSEVFYGVGMKVYDLLAGRLNLFPSHTLSRRAALEAMPTLEGQGLVGAVVYSDGQFDDARLAITLNRTLQSLGGTALNYAPVVGLLKSNGKVAGVRVKDSETAEEIEISGKVVINATGVFVDSLRQMDEVGTAPMLSPSQGVHLVVDREFMPTAHALMIPRTDDGRVLFGLPWHGKVILGTTDTPVEKVALEPRALPQEVEFILRTAQRYLTKKPSPSDVRSVYAGLRPLVKAEGKGTASTAALSRDHTIRISPSGLVTITGGKWTTYRKMGEDVVGKAIPVGGLTDSPSKTVHLRLWGASEEKHDDTLQVYGLDVPVLKALPGADVLLHPRLPYSEAQVRFAARYEMARTVEDVLSRRTRALLLDAAASAEVAGRVAQILAEELAYSPAWQSEQVEEYQKLAMGYRLG
jgi:glycerol-3-phosphate dehydrogenase